jgi:hypothetical protein
MRNRFESRGFGSAGKSLLSSLLPKKILFLYNFKTVKYVSIETGGRDAGNGAISH